MENKYNKKMEKLMEKWRSMTDIEKCNLAVESAGVRNAHYFKDVMKIMCNISDVRVFNMISDMIGNLEDMNDTEREYIVYKLFGEKSSKVFKEFINMVSDAVKVANEDIKDKKEV